MPKGPLPAKLPLPMFEFSTWAIVFVITIMVLLIILAAVILQHRGNRANRTARPQRRGARAFGSRRA
jgi:hypothetical protein